MCFHDLFNGVAQGVTQRESGIVRFDFRQVAVVANMISDAVIFEILVLLRNSGMSFANLKCLKNGAAVLFPAAQVVNIS